MIDERSSLNPSQQRVVRTTEGPVLVIAGAGSGKTRVIEYRVLYLLDRGVEPASILLLTFTRRAAREMLSRAAHHDRRSQKVEGGTFHSFAYGVLKNHCRLLGLDSFLVIDEDDAQEAINICIKRLAPSEVKDGQKRFPKKDTVRKILSMAVNKECSIPEVLEREYPDYAEYAQEVRQIQTEYAAYKRLHQYLDYDDLLVNLKKALHENPELTRRLSERYRYIMVDEYQDTNKLQADILWLLASSHTNIMVVGDDAQSIYGFRGASHKNIMDFPKRFAGCNVIKLEDNYRSHQAILDVANAVLDDMRDKYPKRLVAVHEGPSDKPALFLFRNVYDEAQWITQSVDDARRRGVALAQQSVLFRSAYVSIPLQAALSKAGIPYRVFGGMKFYETAHVKDVLAHLKLMVNPRDEISWMRALTLIEGIGPRTARTIVTDLFTSYAGGIDFEAYFKSFCSRHKAARHAGRLGVLLNKLMRLAPDPAQQFSEALRYYRPLLKEKFDDWQQRMADLEVLQDLCGRYRSTADFLAEFALDPLERQPGARGIDPGDTADTLTLSTIHSAKGLEWEQVFLTGLSEGVLPVSFAFDDEDSLEEEKRLLYVAITRAKRALYLCVHHEGIGFGTVQYNRISRFIDQPQVLATLSQKAVLSEFDEYPSPTYQYE